MSRVATKNLTVITTAIMLATAFCTSVRSFAYADGVRAEYGGGGNNATECSTPANVSTYACDGHFAEAKLGYSWVYYKFKSGVSVPAKFTFPTSTTNTAYGTFQQGKADIDGCNSGYDGFWVLAYNTRLEYEKSQHDKLGTSWTAYVDHNGDGDYYDWGEKYSHNVENRHVTDYNGKRTDVANAWRLSYTGGYFDYNGNHHKANPNTATGGYIYWQYAKDGANVDGQTGGRDFSYFKKNYNSKIPGHTAQPISEDEIFKYFINTGRNVDGDFKIGFSTKNDGTGVTELATSKYSGIWVTDTSDSDYNSPKNLYRIFKKLRSTGLDPTTTAWFCWKEEDDSTHTFTATSTGYAIKGNKANNNSNYESAGDGSTVTINKESTKVKIEHKIKHATGTDTTSLAAKYLINGSSANLRENKDGSSSNLTISGGSGENGYPTASLDKMKTTADKKGVDQQYDTITKSDTVSLLPGQKKETYSTIHLMQKYSNSTYSNPGSPGRYSIYVYRPPAYFNGKVSASVTGSNANCTGSPTSITGGTGNGYTCQIKNSSNFTVTFNNVINRKDNPNGTAGGTVSSQYQITAFGTLYAKQYASLKNNSGTDNIKKEKTDLTVGFGVSKNYCDSLTYNSYVGYNNTTNAVAKTNATIGALCVKAYRNPAKFTGSISIKNGTTEMNSTDTYSTESISSLSFRGLFERINNTSGNGKKASYRNAKVYILGSAGSPLWTIADGTTSAVLYEAASGSYKKSTSVLILTKSGTDLNGWLGLNYGETVTVCASMEYAATFSNGSYQDWTPVGKCVKLKRPEAKCFTSDNAGNYDFGINKGRDAARIRVYGVRSSGSNVGGSWTLIPSANGSWGHTASYPNNYVMRTSIVARSDDRLRFDYEVCGGTHFPVIYNNVSNYNLRFEVSGTRTKGYASQDIGETIKRYTPTASNTGHSDLFKGSDGVMPIHSSNKFLFPSDITNLASYRNPVRLYTSKSGGTMQHNSSVYYADTTRNFLTADRISGTPSSWSDSKWTNLVSNNYFSFGASSPTSGYNYTYDAGLTSAASGNDGYYIRKEGNAGDNNLDVGKTISQAISWNDVSYSNGAYQASNNIRTAEAEVFIPFNYELRTNVTVPASGVAYVGDSVSFTPQVRVAKRQNIDISTTDSSVNTYATITKKTHYRVEAYIAGSGSRRLISSSDTKRFNSAGNIDGTENSPENIAANITVEENFEGHAVVAGDKLCVDFTVWPMDSHNLYGSSTNARQLANGITTSMDDEFDDITSTTSQTRTACVTIAKRPTMSVESSNVYSKNGYKTTLYAKKFQKGGTDYLFGSWSEYGVFGKVTKDNMIMTSGASLGYETTNSSRKPINGTRANPAITAITGGAGTRSNAAYNKPTGDGYCRYMTQTFANNNCNPSNNSIGGTSASMFSDRLKSDYGSIATKVSDFNSVTVAAVPATTKGSSRTIAVKNDGGTISGIPNMNDVNGASHLVVNTLVYDARNSYGNANLNITGNIEPNGNYSSVSTMQGIADVKKVIIFADNVNIDKSVTHIDATIIAKSLTTCSGYSVGGKLQECGNQLVFSSPVVVSDSLYLLRSYGAGSGNSSITRAEIFNLSPETYFWSFYEMSSRRQAVTTYQRELPARY